MSIHIGAEKGDIAESVLMPGDPMRAKFMAENFLEDVKLYNSVRGMYGFTGIYEGKRVSIQGSGMGLPSFSIYTNELIREYDVKKIIRIGSCGSFQKNIELRDIILAMSASTDSNINRIKFSGLDFAPCADFDLLNAVYNNAKDLKSNIHVGGILSSDIFYQDDPDSWKLWAGYNVLGVEMESSALYTLAAQYGIKALSILTVSDSIVSGGNLTSRERETSFKDMVKLALSVC